MRKDHIRDPTRRSLLTQYVYTQTYIQKSFEIGRSTFLLGLAVSKRADWKAVLEKKRLHRYGVRFTVRESRLNYVQVKREVSLLWTCTYGHFFKNLGTYLSRSFSCRCMLKFILLSWIIEGDFKGFFGGFFKEKIKSSPTTPHRKTILIVFLSIAQILCVFILLFGQRWRNRVREEEKKKRETALTK